MRFEAQTVEMDEHRCTVAAHRTIAIASVHYDRPRRPCIFSDQIHCNGKISVECYIGNPSCSDRVLKHTNNTVCIGLSGAGARSNIAGIIRSPRQLNTRKLH